MIGKLFLQVILIVLSALLVSAEASAVEISDSRLEKLAESGDRRAQRLRKLTVQPTRLISSSKTGAALLGLFGTAAAAFNFAPELSDILSDHGLSVELSDVLAVVIITLAAAIFIIVFGEIVPRRAAQKNPERKALTLSGVLKIFCTVILPFTVIQRLASHAILRLMGIDPNADDSTVTEEEILMMSDAGAEKGTIDEDENRIIKNVFAFDDMTAGQICTHRTDVSVLWSEDEPSVWEETIHRTRHSVFPICGESVDNVIGVLDAKDYFSLDDKSRESIMQNAVREPYFVHENMKADRLFAQMKRDGSLHFAVVVDEYGGMSGIITVTDLVEQLVGDFDYDDPDEPEARLESIGENEWSVPGITPLSEVCEELGIELPEDKFETFGGYVIAELGEIPKDGTQAELEAGGLHIEVQQVEHHRIELCRVSIIPVENEEDT